MHQTPTDETLLARIQEGSHPAFRMLVERHAERFYRLAFRYLSQREEAEDTVQEAFLKLWERPEIWRPGGEAKFTTWFYRVVTNMCLDRQRRQKQVPLPEEWEIADERMTQEASAIARQEQGRLEQAIRALPERQQAALNLCFYEGVSNRDAAAILQVNIKALESLLMRAKAALKTTLQPKESSHARAHRITA